MTSPLKKFIVSAITTLILTTGNAWQANASSTDPFIHERLTRSVTFSDSLSDTGNLFSVSGFPPTTIVDPSTGIPSDGYFQGRFANGPVWIEYFIETLELSPSSGLPSNFGGTNYSWGGAETGDDISTRGTPNIGSQIGIFYGNVSNGNAIPLDPDALIVLWAGANDYVNNPTNQNHVAAQDLVGNIRRHIEDLIALGGKNFLVPNMPALGQLPRFVNTESELQFDNLSSQFNEELSVALEDLEAVHDIVIFRFNVFDLVLQMVNNPSVFGFENVTDTAKSIVGEDSSTFFYGSVVDNPEKYMFFDDVHPTTRTHEILGDFAFNASVIGSLVEALENDEIEIEGRNSDKTRDGLVNKLTDAEEKIDQGKFSDAIEKLAGFRDKTINLVDTGKLDEDVAQSMVDATDAVIASLSAYVP